MVMKVHIVSWVYVDEACAINGKEHWTGRFSQYGLPLIVETNVVYALNFKLGWNLVKTEVMGTMNLKMSRRRTGQL